MNYLWGRAPAYAPAALTRAAVDSGYGYLCANDHLHLSRPWLDGPSALAAVAGESGDLTLATTVSLPVVRGPIQLAKALTAIDILSDGRLLVGVGPGSSARDYAAIGLPFDDRWCRFDEAVRFLCSLLAGENADVALEPRPVQRPKPPVWIASWGSAPGIRRVARHGEGWLASAYNTTPEHFRDCLARLDEELILRGQQGPPPNAIVTAWLYVTEDLPRSARSAWPRSRPPARSVCSSGRCRTRCDSSSCSGNAWRHPVSESRSRGHPPAAPRARPPP